MPRHEKMLFSELYERVICAPGICSGCGACVLVCPKHRLVFRDGRPAQVDGRSDVCPENADGRCGLCVMACPRFDRAAPAAAESPAAAELPMTAARCTDESLRPGAQDGGLVSALLRWGLDTGAWASCVCCTRDEEWVPHPLVATDSRDVTRAGGSKYTYLPIEGGLRLLHDQGLSSRPFAVVGLPCHVDAIRRLQAMNSKYVRGLALVIGLFCTKAFTYERLIRGRFSHEMGIAMRDVVKMDIRRGVFAVQTGSGETREVPVKDLQDCAHPGCASCTDFAAERADLAVGGLGIAGWTMAVARTAAGERAMNEARQQGYLETAGAERFPKAAASLEKQSAWKRANALKP